MVSRSQNGEPPMFWSQWQGLIWSAARNDGGWRPYDGGGVHDPESPTGGHYNHLHITVR